MISFILIDFIYLYRQECRDTPVTPKRRDTPVSPLEQAAFKNTTFFSFFHLWAKYFFLYLLLGILIILMQKHVTHQWKLYVGIPNIKCEGDCEKEEFSQIWWRWRFEMCLLYARTNSYEYMLILETK